MVGFGRGGMEAAVLRVQQHIERVLYHVLVILACHLQVNEVKGAVVIFAQSDIHAHRSHKGALHEHS